MNVAPLVRPLGAVPWCGHTLKSVARVPGGVAWARKLVAVATKIDQRSALRPGTQSAAHQTPNERLRAPCNGASPRRPRSAAAAVVFTNVKLGGKRFEAKTRPPEDQMFLDKMGIEGNTSFVPQPPSNGGEDMDAANAAVLQRAILEEQRWVRIVANDHENLPVGFALAWAAVVCMAILASKAGGLGDDDKSSRLAAAHVVGVALHGVGRIGHTVTYAYSLQPWRTVTWSLSQLGMLVIACNLLAVAAEL